MRNKKIISIILIVLALFAVFISRYIDALEIHHECIGEDCPICQMIELYTGTIRQMGTALIVIVMHGLTVSIVKNVIQCKQEYLLVDTLISKKVRMDN